jgi:hypothetical protein
MNWRTVTQEDYPSGWTCPIRSGSIDSVAWEDDMEDEETAFRGFSSGKTDTVAGSDDMEDEEWSSEWGDDMEDG